MRTHWVNRGDVSLVDQWSINKSWSINKLAPWSINELAEGSPSFMGRRGGERRRMGVEMTREGAGRGGRPAALLTAWLEDPRVFG